MCSLGVRTEGSAVEKGAGAAAAGMQFGHWVPLLVRTAAPALFSRGEQRALSKMEVFVTQEILEFSVP